MAENEEKVTPVSGSTAPEKDPEHWRQPPAEPYCKGDCYNCPHPCH